MIPPYTYAAARRAEEHANDTMREGELAHLLKISRLARFGLVDWLLARAGRLLASIGESLRERCTLFLNSSGACEWREPAGQCC